MLSRNEAILHAALEQTDRAAKLYDRGEALLSRMEALVDRLEQRRDL
jgi:hypothetical protein